MITIAKLPGGLYAASFEACGPTFGWCQVHVKTSKDGLNWGSVTDFGVAPTTPDGQSLTGNPYIVWSPGGGPNGEVMLSGEYEGPYYSIPSQIVLVNNDPNLSASSWYWMPQPYYSGDRYSGDLLPSWDGQQLRAASGDNTAGKEITGIATSGALPARDNFASGSDHGWLDYGGSWSVSQDAYSDSGGQGTRLSPVRRSGRTTPYKRMCA